MNTFYKLFVVKRDQDTCILLYGYGLIAHNEARGWSSGLIDKKLNLYRLTCVMDEESSLKFKECLINKENISLTKEFSIKSGFVKRPDTIMYPKNYPSANSESILKSMSKVKEYWNLNKILLMQELQDVYKNKGARNQREKIHDVIARVSQEVSISFFNEAAERLGNIEIYIPNEWTDKFELETKRAVGESASDITVKGIKVNKKGNVGFNLLVNCVLSNSDRCVLNQIKRMNIEDDSVEFDANEEISEINLNIWNKESGELVYTSHGHLMNQMILSMNISDNTKYLVHDEWTDKLEKTFGGSKEKIEKINEIRKVEYNTTPIVSKTGDYKNDPWSKAGSLSQKLINMYRHENVKGAFCKKVGEGDCEIDSFCKIAEYLNQPKVRKVIIVDPYFSIKAMEKFLARVENTKLELEIIASLSDIDPDKDVKNAKNTNYLNEVKEFLDRNSVIIHRSLRIINITQNRNTAIHDRYLLRLLDDGTMDGYLLSNSLNSAGQNYSFVIAPMDKEVTFRVLEYVDELKDEEIQNKKSKSEKLQIEILWDTVHEQYKKESISIIPPKEWEQYMITNYSDGQVLELEKLFYNGWDLTEETAKESILKLGWYLYYSDKMKMMPSLIQFINSKVGSDKFLSICNRIAVELEREEKLYEENDFNSKRSQVYVFRNALNREKQEDLKMNAKYLMNNGYIPPFFYKVNKYVEGLYGVIYNINHKELVNIMEMAHSPKAMQLLLNKMILNSDLDFEVYDRLLISDIDWIREWAYHYFNLVIIKKLKNGESVNYKVLENISDENRIYQYASCIQTISFEMERIKMGNECDLDYLSKLNDLLSYCVKEEAKLIKEEVDFDRKRLFKLINGPNEKINYENYVMLLELISKRDCKNIFFEKMIDLLKQKWEQDKQFFATCDYHVTYYAAYACLEYWNNDVETIFKELRINNKSLYIATEPGKYDMNYEEWNKAIQKVLWQILFLKYYKEVLNKQKMIGDENYNKIIEKITEFSAIKKQCERWYDSDGLVAEVFQ
ncbi:VPA1262 family protein [Clostridium sporogenes]|uniref:VPA1262 family protein n=1 Tax=Clostridium TaxID=1485 RepID=UPI000E02DE84|nr:VPA1262 family protein [Clostridium sporogenes]MCW6084241.1 hypothetical protein [Clostridium sporogenes]STC79749.1 Uncharacterised protein [Clostridium botulinum]